MMKSKDNEQKKTTSEKPVSLSPLNFKDALSALLKVKPKTEEDQDEEEAEKKNEHEQK